MPVTRDLTTGSETKAMLWLGLPMIAGNLLQQMYHMADTLIVGRYLGAQALAAVGSSYALMVFLTSVNLGLCMGSGVVFSRLFGAGRAVELKAAVCNAFCAIGLVNLGINAAAFVLLEPLLRLLRIQPEVLTDTRAYLQAVLWGMLFTFLFHFVAAALRSVGNSLAPLVFLSLSALLNIGLDFLFVLGLGWGIAGAAWATVVSQGLSSLCLLGYCLRRVPQLRPARGDFNYSPTLLRQIVASSLLTSVQQSVMNFGVLMVQGLVNSFGVAAMAAFAAAVKIDSLAYMPVQDFGNACSTYIAQNYGAGKYGRIRSGLRRAAALSLLFSVGVSSLVIVYAPELMRLFVQGEETEIIAIGVGYLRIEGSFYCLIALLFLLYGYYRGIGRPGMSVVLTVLSLGTRVALAYLLAPLEAIGLPGVWWAIPIGWLLADGVGLLCLKRVGRLPAVGAGE